MKELEVLMMQNKKFCAEIAHGVSAKKRFVHLIYLWRLLGVNCLYLEKKYYLKKIEATQQ